MESATLLKFGQKCHIEAMRDHGILYLNSLQYFKELEEGSGRGDRWEGAASRHQGKAGKVTVRTPEGKERDLQIVFWEFLAALPLARQLNVFCMYALRPTQGAFPVPEENFAFGDYALVLLDAQAFMDRVVSVAKQAKVFYRAGLVEYVPAGYTGDLGPFKKRDLFRYQHEWRLVCKNGDGRPRILEIGSLASISRIIRSDEVNHEIRVV